MTCAPTFNSVEVLILDVKTMTNINSEIGMGKIVHGRERRTKQCDAQNWILQMMEKVFLSPVDLPADTAIVKTKRRFVSMQ